MISSLIHRRKARARLLIKITRVCAVALIGAIGFYELFVGHGWETGLFSGSNMRTSLNILQNDNGQFRLSFEVQPHQKDAVASPNDKAITPVTSAKSDNSQAEISRNEPVSSPVVSIASSGSVAVRENKVSSCALGAPLSKSSNSNDGKLLRVTFPVTSARVDGYGVNDVAIEQMANQPQSRDTLRILHWVRAQGGLSGYSNVVDRAPARQMPLPNLVSGNLGGSGDDYAMSVAHDAVDFLAVGVSDYTS